MCVACTNEVHLGNSLEICKAGQRYVCFGALFAVVGGRRRKREQASVLLDSMHNNIPKHLMYLLPLTTHVLHLSDGCREEICSHSTCGKVN